MYYISSNELLKLCMIFLSQNWREMPRSPLARKKLLENNYELTGIKACICYFHQKGPGTSDQSLFRLWNNFRKTLLIMYYLTKFDDVILSSFWVILKITSVNLCKPIYEIMNYSTSIYPFESGKCGKGKKYKNLNISRTKRAF